MSVELKHAVPPSTCQPLSVGRVALVVDSLAAGGKERVVATLAGQLRRKGLAVAVVCLSRSGPLAQGLAQAGAAVYSVTSRGRWDLGAVLRLSKILQHIRPDVVNVHDRFSLPYLVAANRIATGAPIVLSCHGLLLSSVRPTWAQVLAARDVDAFTAVSPEVAAAYARFLRAGKPFELLANGIDPIEPDAERGRQLRDDLGIDPSTFVFLSVGAVKAEKGYSDLLAACERLCARNGGESLTVLVAGAPAEQSHLEELQQQVADKRLGCVIRFLGHVDNVAALYAAADALVLPSRTEGLPLALLEAMSAGLPVVATAVGGVPGLLATAEAGLLVPPARPDALADAMAELLESPTLRSGLSRRAAGVVRRYYGAEAMADGYIELFDEVVRTAQITRSPRTGAGPDVVMLGPQTPPTGGMASVVRAMRRSGLARQTRLTVINNGKTTRRGRTLISGLAAQAGLLWRLIWAIAAGRADLVHIHTCSGRTFWRDGVHALVARLMRRDVIWHVHGGRFADFAAGRGPLGRAVMRRAFESASAVIVLGDIWRRRLMPFAPRARWRVVPNGVPLADGPRGEPGETFLFLGHFGRDKGAAELVQAAALAAGGGRKLRVDLAGHETAPHQRDKLADVAARAGLEDHVRFLGVLAGPAKQAALASAGCVVLPSYVEAMPMAILEAMAHGRAVIATGVGAVAEVITDGVEGFLIAAGDADALADAMTRLAEDPSLRQRMGRAGRRRAEQRFSADAMGERVLAIYNDVLEARR